MVEENSKTTSCKNSIAHLSEFFLNLRDGILNLIERIRNEVTVQRKSPTNSANS